VMMENSAMTNSTQYLLFM